MNAGWLGARGPGERATQVAEFPIMPFYVDAYIGDTMRLTTTEHGAYLLILFAMWRAGGVLPNDDRTLARTAKLTSGQWKRIKPVLMGPFLHVEGGFVTQAKLLETIKAVKRKIQSRSDAARARWLKTKGPSYAIAAAMHMQNDAIQIERKIATPLVQSTTPVNGSASSKPEASGKVEPIEVSAALAARYTQRRTA